MACFLSRRRRWRRRVAGVSRRRPRGSGRVDAAESAVRRWLHRAQAKRGRRRRRVRRRRRAAKAMRPEGAVKFIFRAASDSRTRSRSSPCPHRRAVSGHLYPLLIFELLCAVTWGRKRAKTRCWRSLLAWICRCAGPRLRRQRCNRLVVAWEYVSAAAGKNPACSERLSGE